jgi:methyl-accepting chemotaxis protein
MKQISIKERLILYFVVLSVISIAIVSLFSIFEAKKGITNRTFSQLILLRDLRKEQIITFFQSRVNELKSLASSGEILTLDELVNSHYHEKSIVEILAGEKQLINLVCDTAFCKSLYFFSSSGKVVTLNSSGAFTPYEGTINLSVDSGFRVVPGNGERQTEMMICELIDSLNSSRIFIAAPVFDKSNRYKGYLSIEILPDAINRIIFANNPGTGMGKTGEAYLVGSDGLMRSPSRFVPEAIMNISGKDRRLCQGIRRQGGGRTL